MLKYSLTAYVGCVAVFVTGIGFLFFGWPHEWVLVSLIPLITGMSLLLTAMDIPDTDSLICNHCGRLADYEGARYGDMCLECLEGIIIKERRLK